MTSTGARSESPPVGYAGPPTGSRSDYSGSARRVRRTPAGWGAATPPARPVHGGRDRLRCDGPAARAARRLPPSRSWPVPRSRLGVPTAGPHPLRSSCRCRAWATAWVAWASTACESSRSEAETSPSTRRYSCTSSACSRSHETAARIAGYAARWNVAWTQVPPRTASQEICRSSASSVISGMPRPAPLLEPRYIPRPPSLTQMITACARERCRGIERPRADAAVGVVDGVMSRLDEDEIDVRESVCPNPLPGQYGDQFVPHPSDASGRRGQHALIDERSAAVGTIDGFRTGDLVGQHDVRHLTATVPGDAVSALRLVKDDRFLTPL